jgi:hypothetical protein
MFHKPLNNRTEKRLEIWELGIRNRELAHSSHNKQPFKSVINMFNSKSYQMKTFATGIFLFACLTILLSFNASVPVERKLDPVKKAQGSSKTLFFQSIYQQISASGANLSEEVFSFALIGFNKLRSEGRVSKDSILTIIDFSKSSKEKRMFVVDLKSQKLLISSLVAHGKNSGREYARHFSNKPESFQSSLGFYSTGKIYDGSNGKSLILEGLEKGFNDNAKERAIVMHGADYASEQIARKNGCLGRSLGCPALPKKITRKTIETIKGGNCLFIYYPDQKYLYGSEIING